MTLRSTGKSARARTRAAGPAAYGGVHKGMPVVTIELPSALLTPRNVEIQRMWTDLRQWMGVTLADALSGTAEPGAVQP